MFLIRGKYVKIAYVVRVDLSLSGGYIVGGDRGVVDELYSALVRKKHVSPELYRKIWLLATASSIIFLKNKIK
jgi:hypothetical protein